MTQVTAYAIVTAKLHPRQVEVLKLLTTGRSRKEAASDLNVSLKTVDKHIDQVMKKTKLHSIVLLTHWALRNEFISLIDNLPQAG